VQIIEEKNIALNNFDVKYEKRFLRNESENVSSE
jgi:hypothetical protein